MINPRTTTTYYVDAAVAIDEAIRARDPERLARMRRLGGPHQPPGGPAPKFVALAEALAGAYAIIDSLERRIEELEEA